MKTIFHHLMFPDILDIEPDSYYYCANEACAVGYFSPQGNIIAKKQLRTFSKIKTLYYYFDINTQQYLNFLKMGQQF